MAILVFALVAMVVVSEAGESHYCNICRYHTLCGTRSGGSLCINHRSMPPSSRDKRALLHSHNRFRDRIARGREIKGNAGPQYPAANMMKMEWDDELARIAQRAADQCIYDHDCAACRSVDRFGVGQNIAIQWNSNQQTKVNYIGLAEDWYLTEVGLMNREYAKKYVFSKKWGHSSQVTWWNSRLVGCGSSFFDYKGWKAQILYCNYGSEGNMSGAKMYEVGPAASKCPGGTQRDSKYRGLCALKTPSAKFSTDGVLLGLLPGSFALPPSCKKDGFRLYRIVKKG